MWHRLYYHLVWTTRLREPLLDAAAAQFLCPFFRSVSARYRARILAVGAVSTHVHVLIAGDPQTDFPKLVGHLKGGKRDDVEQTARRVRRVEDAMGAGIRALYRRAVPGPKRP